MFWDRPANAITTRCRTPSAGRYAHPTQDRGLSVREAALLQGFPPDYFFEGPFDDKFKQIGNAVSPLFAQAIAEHLDTEWFSDHDTAIDTCGDIIRPINKSISSTLASVKRLIQTSKLYRDTSELIAAKYAS
jgi:DNA (cytosine-5)-methyltransferase 1